VFLFLSACASDSQDSNFYEVRVQFYPPKSLEIIQKVEILTRVGIPFEVQTQDKTGNHYEVAGILRKKTERIFRLNEVRTTVQSSFGKDSSWGGDIELDKWSPLSWSGFANGFGCSLSVARAKRLNTKSVFRPPN
jgi:hypothetical protein